MRTTNRAAVNCAWLCAQSIATKYRLHHKPGPQRGRKLHRALYPVSTKKSTACYWGDAKAYLRPAPHLMTPHNQQEMGILFTTHFLLSVCGAQVCKGTEGGEVSGLWTCGRGERTRDCEPFLNPHVLFFFIQGPHWLHSPSSHSEAR